MDRLNLPTPEQIDEIAALDIKSAVSVVQAVIRQAYLRDGWLRCVVEIDGPPGTLNIRVNALEDVEEDLGLVVKDRRRQ